jgi:hypothetical protein
MTDWKAELEERKISIRSIASDLSLSHSVVSQVLANIYTGSEDTKKRVLDHIEFILQDKADLNSIIYEHGETFQKVLMSAIKNTKFDENETEMMIKVYRIIKNYNEARRVEKES